MTLRDFAKKADNLCLAKSTITLEPSHSCVVFIGFWSEDFAIIRMVIHLVACFMTILGHAAIS